MISLPSRDDRTARLLRAIVRGERLAQRTAARQAQRAPLPILRRMLAAQARHEHVHAVAFAAAARVFDARERSATTPLDRAFDSFARQLDRDVAHGPLAASFVGLQGVLEGLGEALMRQLDAASDTRTAGFDALRRRFMLQEQGHQALGARCLRTLQDDDAVRAAGDCYRDMGEALIRTGAAAFCESPHEQARFLALTRLEMDRWFAGALSS